MAKQIKTYTPDKLDELYKRGVRLLMAQHGKQRFSDPMLEIRNQRMVA